MIEIDGSQGEGGGQMLRTSLSLSMATGQPFRIFNLRANRKKPGLKRQHLTAVRAAAEISGASVQGDILESREVIFEPGPVQPGHFRFDIGTAGSTTLVFQTLLPVLMRAAEPSHLTLEGGTHNGMSPPWDFLETAFLPLLESLGPKVSLKLIRRGFFPEGGGRFEALIQPVESLGSLTLLEREKKPTCKATAIVSNLPEHIAQRELDVLCRRLPFGEWQRNVEVDKSARGPGNMLMVKINMGNVTELFSALGEKRVSAEQVAAGLARECKAFLKSSAPIGPHLADQLLLPLALGAGGRYRTPSPLNLHVITNAEVIQQFLDVEISFIEMDDETTEITVRPPTSPGFAPGLTK
jgi:RNA 3'-terminal phosphate cyclase (ATP)